MIYKFETEKHTQRAIGFPTIGWLILVLRPKLISVSLILYLPFYSEKYRNVRFQIWRFKFGASKGGLNSTKKTTVNFGIKYYKKEV